MRKITRDVIILCISIGVAVVLSKTGALDLFFERTTGASLLAIFVAGMFFTSIVTIGPAALTLFKLSAFVHPVAFAVVGGLGGVIGDLVIYLFVKDNLVKDAQYLLRPLHVRKLFRFHFLRWLGPFIGALVIISPLPDELGLALMGFRSISLKILVPLLFALDFVAVLLVALVARA